MPARFQTETGLPVPAVTTTQMREVDRAAVEEFHLGLLQMMENAGRALAAHALLMRPFEGSITVVAGAGGNGGGVLCCARHLHNHGIPVQCVLDRPLDTLKGAARQQADILVASGLTLRVAEAGEEAVQRSSLIVDGLIGYGLQGEPRPAAAQLIEVCNRSRAIILSNDVPSGINATTGEAHGPHIHAARIVTLAAPKTGLAGLRGELYLADIGIPPEVFERVGIPFPPPWEGHSWVRLESSSGS
jgi:NAD(P)H-hydrate epimerase